MDYLTNSFSLSPTLSIWTKTRLKLYEIMLFVSAISIVPLRIFTYIQTLPNYLRLLLTFGSIACFLVGVLLSPKKERNRLLSLLCISFVFCTLNWLGQWKDRISFFEKMYANYLFFLPFLLSIFFLKWSKVKYKKVLLLYIFILEIITLITTILGLRQYPTAARDLASEAASNPVYKQLNIGGYDFIYGLVVLLPTILFFINQRKHKIIWLFLLVASIYCIVISQYSIAIVLSFGIIVIYFLLRVKSIEARFFLILFFVLGLLAILLFSETIFLTLSGFFKTINLDGVATKFYDLSRSLSSNSSSGTVESRFYQYKLSFLAILESPLYGHIFEQASAGGGHSEIMDIWVAGGIFAFLVAFYMCHKHLNSFKRHCSNKCLLNSYFLGYFAFIAISSFNTVLNSPLICINAFLIPALIVNIDESGFQKKRG